MDVFPIPPFLPTGEPIPQVTPFTFRDGMTILNRFERLVKYINRVVLPTINEQVNDLDQKVTDEINALIAQVNAAIEAVINSSIELQDPVMAALIADDTSDSRVQLDLIYTKLTDFNELVTTVNDLIDTVNANKTDADTKITNLTNSTNTAIASINTELTGRLSNSTLDGRYAAKPSYNAEGVHLYSYGHSYTIVPNPYTTQNGGEYPLKVANRINAADVVTAGRSGTPLPDQFMNALAPTPDGVYGGRQWVPDSTGIVLLECYMNEAANGTYGGDAGFITMWKLYLRALYSLMGCSSKIDAAGMTFTGSGWTNFTSPDIKHAFSAEDARFSANIGDKASFTVSGDEVWIVGIAAVSSYSSGRLQVKVGSTTVTTITTQGVKSALFNSVNRPEMNNYLPMAYQVKGLNVAAGTTGLKTVDVYVVDATNTFINCAFVPGARPPLILTAYEPRRGPQATSGSANFDANEGLYRAAIDEVNADYSNAHAVDLRPGWDLTKFVASLDTVNNFHPNDLGHSFIADKFEAAIKQYTPTAVNGVMVL